jgi:predicted nucleic acid-binding protein
MSLFLDTSAIIEWERNNPKVVSFIRAEKEINISSICVYETLVGLKREKRRKVLDFFSSFPLTSFNSDDSFLAAEIYQALTKNGKVVNSRDILIAAQAKRRNLRILTGDVDYSVIDRAFGLDVIKIEDLK